MGYLKIVVKIPDAIYPELVADLERVQLRDRAERVRVLAMLGLRYAPYRIDHQTVIQCAEASAQASTESVTSANKLIQKLSESL